MNYDPTYSPPSRPFDASIPVLTEVLAVPASAEAPAPAEADDPFAPLFDETPAARQPAWQELAPPVPDAVPDTATGDQLERFAIDGLNGLEWEVLERRLAERILLQLQDRVDAALEQRLRDSMAEVLHRALADLTEELHKGLQQTLKQVVARAVSEEVAHLQALKN